MNEQTELLTAIRDILTRIEKMLEEAQTERQADKAKSKA